MPPLFLPLFSVAQALLPVRGVIHATTG